MNVDVAIVGGGPAASTAAICLSRAGYSVAVIAARSQKEKPTETSKPQLHQLLKTIGAESALSCCQPCHGIISDWGTMSECLKPSILDPFGHPWFIDRNRFDLHLKSLAEESGVAWTEANANDAEIDENHVTINTSVGTFITKWLVIGNGSLYWSSRVTKQPIITEDSLIASWTRLNSTLTEKFLLTETCDDGWWYSCPDLKGGTIVCFVTDQEGSRELKSFSAEQWDKLYLQTRLSKKLPQVQTVRNVNTLRTGVAALARRYGKRWISIGDAAVLLDPLGSSGTATAIESAYRASSAVDAALRGDQTRLQFYEDWSEGMFHEFIKQRTARYQSECDLRHSAFWQKRQKRPEKEQQLITARIEAKR